MMNRRKEELCTRGRTEIESERDEGAAEGEGRAAAGEGRVAASAHLAHAASTRTRDRDEPKGGYWPERERAREGGWAGWAREGKGEHGRE